MATLSRLLRVGSLAGSLGVYVPAVVLQKAVGLGRVLVFTYLLPDAQSQYGLWGLSLMVFHLGAAVLTLGSNQGLVRYVSVYEARGQLLEFWRRIRWPVLLVGLALTAAAIAGSKYVTYWAFVSRQDVQTVPYRQLQVLCWVALVNALLMAMYHNMLGFMVGMRAYRLVSALEVAFALLFTAAGAIAIFIAPAGHGCLAILVAHAAALGVVLVGGMALLSAAVRHVQEHAEAIPPVDAGEAIVLPPGAEEEGAISVAPVSRRETEPAAPIDRRTLARVMTFGIVSSISTLLWYFSYYISFRLTSWFHGEKKAGPFLVFLQLSQPILFVANAAWTVLFTHVARRWESGKRRSAMLSLETAYKAVTLTMMTLAVVLSVGAPLWIRILPEGYRGGREVLGGMLMFFQVLNHLTLMTILAKLHERPAVIGLAVLVGGAVNALLALVWMPALGAAPDWVPAFVGLRSVWDALSAWAPAHGVAGAAWAAGIGMYVGSGTVTGVYLLAAKVRLRAGTWVTLALPAVLLLTPWPIILVAAWAIVLAAAATSPAILSGEEKDLFRSFGNVVMRRVLQRIRK